MKIALNGKVFNDLDTGPDEDGIYWYVTELDGWDSPPPRTLLSEPTSRHGAVAARALLAPRPMTMRGIVKAPGEETYWRAWNGLQALTRNMYEPVRLVVTENIDKEVRVIRGAQVRQTILGGRAFEYEVPLTALDPLKYATEDVSTTLNAGQTKTVTNDGTHGSERFTITLTSAGYLDLHNLTSGGQRLVSLQELPSGTVLDIHSRTVMDGDDAIYGYLASSSVWWALQPGDNSVKNQGTANVTIRHRHAWL